MSDRGKLGNFLKEVINWNWKEFKDAEADPNYTGLEATVLSLVRTTSEDKLGAIRLAIDRVDGKLETPVKIEYPKVFFLYPHATSVALPDGDHIRAELESGETSLTLNEEPPQAEEGDEPVQLSTLTLRETVRKMADTNRQVITLVLREKKAVDEGKPTVGDPPLVKSVIAANLLHMAIEQNNFDAITEVFDQIDGKLVETIKVLGDDIYLTQYAELAPFGAEKNSDGVYMIEATTVQEQWKQKLKQN